MVRSVAIRRTQLLEIIEDKSMANRNWASAGKIYSMHVKPVLLDCNFVVDSTNGNGLGIRSLKGPCIANVYMHSAATPVVTTSTFSSGATSIVVASATGLTVGMAITDSTTGANIAAGTRISSISGTTIGLSIAAAGNSGSPDTLSFLPLAAGSPGNPAAGVIYVKLMDNYNRSYSGFNAIVAPVSGTPLTAVVANTAYTIVSLGTATLTQWQAVGLPLGVTPAVGVSFIATSSATIGGSAAVEISIATGSNITNIETVGDPNTTLANLAQPSNGGGYIILQCFKNGAKAAPVDGSVISLGFYLSDSSVIVQGE